MRVLAACSLGGAGHLQPLLPLLAAAERRGDDVLVVAPPALREMVTATGHAFEPGGEPEEAEVAPIRERLPVAPPDEASVLGNRDLFATLAARAMRPRMEELCTTWRPDLVLREPCEYSSAAVSGELGLSVATVAISLAGGEASSIEVAAPALERLRGGLVDGIRATPYLTRFPASLDPSPFPTTIRFREPSTDDGAPLPDWWAGLDAPIVYVTFGTVLGHMTIAADVFETALRAVGDLDARTLLTVGRAFDPSALGWIPPHVRVEQWVDQRRVLAVADAVVCHGGSGTVFGAMAAGVPVVMVPVFADQFENAARVAARGAGVVVGVATAPGDAGRTVISLADAPRIAAAVERVLTEASYRRRAVELAAEMAAAPSADAVLARLLEA